MSKYHRLWRIETTYVRFWIFKLAKKKLGRDYQRNIITIKKTSFFFKRQIFEEKLKTKTPCLENVQCTSNNV